MRFGELRVGPPDRDDLFHGFDSAEFHAIKLAAVDAAFCDEGTEEELRKTVAGGWVP